MKQTSDQHPFISSPLISVVIATKNRLSLLQKAIHSVKQQTYPNIELIVVDDGSVDDTVLFCNTVLDLELIEIPTLESKGGNYARNVGIKKATGQYIAFLDDDDLWHPTKLQKQMLLMQRDNADNVGVIYCGFEKHDKSGVLTALVSPKVGKSEDISKYILYNFITLNSCVLVKKELLYQIGLFDEDLKFWQDYELMIRLAQVTRFDFVDEFLMYYLEDLSDKSRLTNKYEEWTKAVTYIFNKHHELYNRLNFVQRVRYKILINHDAVLRLRKNNEFRLVKSVSFKLTMLKLLISPFLLIDKLKK